MQGFIVNINRAKDEDLIVSILTNDSLITTYRFYGARHATINLGYKIDFEVQHSLRSNIPQLRDVLHLPSDWIYKRERLFIWQQFISLFYPHLKDVESVDSFYFDILDKCSGKWSKQNTKRLAVEAYVDILELEGRLHVNPHCFLCDTDIEGDFTLARGFLPAHDKCIYRDSLNALHVKKLFKNKSTIFFSDEEVDFLWKILLEGL